MKCNAVIIYIISSPYENLEISAATVVQRGLWWHGVALGDQSQKLFVEVKSIYIQPAFPAAIFA